MFRRILVANRGEIAVRITRACADLGIESVAVYSDADARSLHVSLADRAVRIGPPPAAESYLSIDAILAAAATSRADAIHPGYGFLAENPAFAAACAGAGLTFIGPPAEVIATLGSKIAARQLAQSVGVPVIPGETPADQSDAGIASAARGVGFPLLLKPSAGGGGIGMKAVHDAAALASAIAQARREAQSAFGDGTLYVEKLLRKPRHVELQVLADNHGNVVHLFERDCSIQRRHQKVIEESPSVAIGHVQRQRMGEAAVGIARAAGYRNAGTVEFLVDGGSEDARFYFVEANTRLQVEHPVTEAVTGVDLVRAQIEIAAGASLPWGQAELGQRGHAIEARIYAEDPAHGYLPQSGPLLLYREPSLPGVRIDSGVAERDVVSVHYDPLLAKLIAWGATRAIATRRAVLALRNFPILGVRTNVSLLVALLEHPRFAAGHVDTELLEDEADQLTAALSHEAGPMVRAVAASAAQPGLANADVGTPLGDPWTTLRGFRV